MIDIILLALSSLCGFCIGKFAEKGAVRREEFYGDLLRYIKALKINLDGRQQLLAQFNSEFADSCSEDFRKCLSDGEVTVKLGAREKKAVAKFFEGLHNSSAQQLSRHLDFYESQFAASLHVAADKGSKAMVYSKLGLLLGVMAGILLL